MKALIVGGNGDIGLGILNNLHKEGYEIYALDKTVSKLQNLHENIKVSQVDLTNSEEIELYVSDFFQPFNVLIYAAGIREIVSVVDLPLSDWKKIQAVNLTGAFIISQYLIRLALQYKHPLCLIFISSISGLYGEPKRASYCASKHGLIGLAKSIAIELAPHQIRANSIAPGIIDTELTRHYKSSSATMEMLKNNIPLERWGQPEHIAQAVDFIIKNDYITGTTLVVDGGWTAGKML